MNKKPTALLDATGAYQKNPQRKRKGDPSPRKGIGPSPGSLPSEFSAVWDEIVDSVCPGVMGNSDRIHLEMTVNLLCEYRRDPEEISVGRLTILQRCLGHLGMNPIDRTRIVAEQEVTVSKQDAYF